MSSVDKSMSVRALAPIRALHDRDAGPIGRRSKQQCDLSFGGQATTRIATA
jgi:hypothetical protein